MGRGADLELYNSSQLEDQSREFYGNGESENCQGAPLEVPFSNSSRPSGGLKLPSPAVALALSGGYGGGGEALAVVCADGGLLLCRDVAHLAGGAGSLTAAQGLTVPMSRASPLAWASLGARGGGDGGSAVLLAAQGAGFALLDWDGRVLATWDGLPGEPPEAAVTAAAGLPAGLAQRGRVGAHTFAVGRASGAVEVFEYRGGARLERRHRRPGRGGVERFRGVHALSWIRATALAVVFARPDDADEGNSGGLWVSAWNPSLAAKSVAR